MDNLSKEKLIKDVKDRVSSIHVPTYETAFSTSDLLEFTSEMQEYSIEMATCSYVAFKHDEIDLAWVCYSKASELLGLCVGTRTLLNRSTKYRRSRKGGYDKSRDNAFIYACLIKSLNQRLDFLNQHPVELLKDLMTDFSSSEAIEEQLLDELVEYAYSLRGSLGKGFIKPTTKDLELNEEEIGWGDEEFTKFKIKVGIEQEIRRNGDLGKVFDDYLEKYTDLVGAEPYIGEKRDDTVNIKIRHLQDMYRVVEENRSIMQDFLAYSECSNDPCPVKEKYKKNNSECELMLMDPLYSLVNKD